MSYAHAVVPQGPGDPELLHRFLVYTELCDLSQEDIAMRRSKRLLEAAVAPLRWPVCPHLQPPGWDLAPEALASARAYVEAQR